MPGSLQQKAFLALLAYYVLLGVFSAALSLLGLTESSNSVVLLLIVAAYLASLWLARDLIERFTSIRITIWSTVWYVLGVPIVVAFVIFLPIGLLLSALFSFEDFLFMGDSTSLNVVEYIIAYLVFAAIGAWLFVREQRNRQQMEEAYAKRQEEEKQSGKTDLSKTDASKKEASSAKKEASNKPSAKKS